MASETDLNSLAGKGEEGGADPRGRDFFKMSENCIKTTKFGGRGRTTSTRLLPVRIFAAQKFSIKKSKIGDKFQFEM